MLRPEIIKIEENAAAYMQKEVEKSEMQQKLLDKYNKVIHDVIYYDNCKAVERNKTRYGRYGRKDQKLNYSMNDRMHGSRNVGNSLEGTVINCEDRDKYETNENGQRVTTVSAKLQARNKDLMHRLLKGRSRTPAELEKLLAEGMSEIEAIESMRETKVKFKGKNDLETRELLDPDDSAELLRQKYETLIDSNIDFEAQFCQRQETKRLSLLSTEHHAWKKVGKLPIPSIAKIDQRSKSSKVGYTRSRCNSQSGTESRMRRTGQTYDEGSVMAEKQHRRKQKKQEEKIHSIYDDLRKDSQSVKQSKNDSQNFRSKSYSTHANTMGREDQKWTQNEQNKHKFEPEETLSQRKAKQDEERQVSEIKRIFKRITKLGWKKDIKEIVKAEKKIVRAHHNFLQRLNKKE